MSEQAMLDVSLIAHRSSLKRLVKLADQEGALAGLRVSAALISRLSYEALDRADIERQIHGYFGVPRRMIDIRMMQELIGSPQFRNSVKPYQSAGGARTQQFRSRLLEDVRERDAWAYEVVVEEWEFLRTHSWVFAKTRAIYDRLVNAGADAIYVTKEKLEQAIAHVAEGAKDTGHAIIRGSDKVVRRTLKKGAEHVVSPNDRVRTIAKWVAVGGGAASALINPVVGVLGVSAGGFFILYDP